MSYLGLVPERFARYSGLERYFAMARGTDDVQLALDMSKYFDTNYRAHPVTRTHAPLIRIRAGNTSPLATGSRAELVPPSLGDTEFA